MTKRLFTWLLGSVITLSMVSGCGFHLRGNYPLPDIMMLAHYSGSPDIEFNQLLEEQLQKQGAQIVDKEQATATLVINKLINKQEVLTKDANGDASSYEFVYEIEYDVFDRLGMSLFEDERTAKQTRFLSYSADLELQFEEEKEFMIEDMREEVILQILRTISAL